MKYELGPLEAKLVFTLEKKGATLFNITDAKKILGCSEKVLRVVLWRLTSKGRIQRVKRGHYLLIPAKAGYKTKWSEHVFAFIDALLDEYYVGYWTALSYWGMTEQIPRTFFVATKKRRRNFNYEAVFIRFVTISPHKFFGWTTETIGEQEFRISDREKTIVDSLDLPQHVGGVLEAVKGLAQDLDWNRVVEYTDKLRNRTVYKRLGYLVETLGLEPPTGIVERLQRNISLGYSWLDPTAPKKVIKTNSRWRLKININI